MHSAGSVFISASIRRRFMSALSKSGNGVETVDSENPFLASKAKRSLERKAVPPPMPKPPRFQAELRVRAKKWVVDSPPKITEEIQQEKEPNQGSIQKELSASENRCAGCGARLQTTEPKRIGYIPEEKLLGPRLDIPPGLDIEALRSILSYKPSQSAAAQVKCERCWKLENYGEVVPVEVTAEQLLQELKHIRTKKALIVKIVDVFDFDGTFVEGFSRFSGSNPIILLVNKIDLLPADVSLERIEKWVRSEAKTRGLDLREVFLVSGFSGLNLRRVAAKIHELRVDRDVFVMGQSNVGKSTIVNKIWPLLNPKDLRKTPKVTVSNVPGTTLSTIGLPFPDGLKFYDTPGIMPEAGLTRAIPLQDYLRVLPKRRFKLRIEGLKLGHSLFLGGLARIDFLSGPSFLNLAVFAVPDVALVQVPTEIADDLFVKHQSDPLLDPFKNRGSATGALPHLSPSRPMLEVKQTFKIDCKEGYNRASADIVFAGLGWVAVAANALVELRCWYLPSCSVIQRPPLIPYDVGKKRKEGERQ